MSATPAGYDALRAKWDAVLTGGSNYNPGDPNYVGIINRITTTAQTDWSTLNTAQNRTYLWPDLQTPATSAQLTEAYTRLEAMALAYSTTGSSLDANQSLKTATIAALDWMYTNRYNPPSRKLATGGIGKSECRYNLIMLPPCCIAI